MPCRGGLHHTLLLPSAIAQTLSPTLEWSWTSSGVEPDALNVMNTPSVIDLNADGVPDVVFSSTASPSGGPRLSEANGAELFTVGETSPVDLRVTATCSLRETSTGTAGLRLSPATSPVAI